MDRTAVQQQNCRLRRRVSGLLVVALFVATGCTQRSEEKKSGDKQSKADRADGQTTQASTVKPSTRPKLGRTESGPAEVDLETARDDFAKAAVGLDQFPVVDADELLTHSRRKQHRYHRVKAGDTLSAICRASGCELADVLRLNGLETDDVLRPGQLIYLPSKDGR